jgi:hypothetical protein
MNAGIKNAGIGDIEIWDEIKHFFPKVKFFC